MPAPVPAFIQLPLDSSNTGKQLRTETRVVGLNTVHEQFVVPTIGMTILGNYFFSSVQQTVLNSAQNGTATGFFWFQMPATATATAVIRTISIDSSAVAATLSATAPQISFTKFSFTGTASGASVTPVKFQTAGVANQMIIRTAVTGMTPTLIGDVGNSILPSILTATGLFSAYEDVIPLDPQGYARGLLLEIAPGEGLVVYQSTGGSSGDPRVFTIQMQWFELDLT